MVTHLLGTEDIDRDFEELILEKTEGVPFFIEEFIKSLKDLKIIEKTDNRYHLTEDIRDVTIPSTIQDIIMASVDCLPGEAKEVLQKGSVIEREFSHELIKRVVDLPEPELLSYLSVLKDAELLYERGIYPESIYIFKHALTREVVYDSILTKRKKSLHEKIAQAIEEVYAERLEEFYGMLAYHYELAEIRERAIHYLTKAADRAKAIYANEEAIAFYRKAIEQLIKLLPEEGESPEDQCRTATQLYESLGDVLEWTGQHDKARDAYESALVQVSKHDSIWQARLHTKIGNVLRLQHRYKEALQAYDLAETALGQEPAESAPEWWQEWLQIQLERMNLLYFMNQWHKISELAEKVRFNVERYGTPAQRVNFFLSLTNMNYRRDRYVVSEETLALCRAALVISQEAGNPSIIAWARFMLGFGHLWRGELREAEEQMQAALTLAERAGDVVHQSRCLTYLTILYRKRGLAEEVRHYISRSLVAATAAQMLEYIAMTKANLAWAAWRQGNLSEAEANGRAALELWQQLPVGHASCAFEWTALWPLIGVALAQDLTSDAVDYGRALLEPSQQCLPYALMGVVEKVIKTWEGGESETICIYLNQAIELAQELGYL
jgi:tetratricopeptide (TPR) repeat protein